MNDLFTTDFSFLGAVDVAKQFTAVPGGQPRAAGKLRTVNGIEYSLTRSEQTRAKIRAASTNISAETRAKRSASLKGRVMPEETRAKLRGKAVSAETRAKIAAANRGRVFSDETRAKLRAASQGRVCSDATRAKLSANFKGKPRSAEVRAKLSAAHLGKPKSAEARANMSAAAQRRGVSAETRAKIGAASRGRVHSAETLARIAAKNGKPIMTPTGVFPSIAAAGKWAVANGLVNAHKKICKWLVTHPDQFYYIPKDAK